MTRAEERRMLRYLVALIQHGFVPMQEQSFVFAPLLKVARP
jgi:hypothetical protein